MRLIKALGLVVPVVAATMAFVGVGTASAFSDIVLCKDAKLTECTPESLVWEDGKTITATTEIVKFLGSYISAECNVSSIGGKALDKFGNPMRWKIESASFTKCGECTVTVENTPEGKFAVDTGDKFLLVLDLKVKITCGMMKTCIYRAVENQLELDKANEKKPVALAKGLFLLGEGGDLFCDAKIAWDATYTLEGGALDINFSLYPLS